MSTTPPDQGPPIPPGYKAGDYIPFADRDPSNPSSIAGQWADPARQAQMHGQQDGRPLTPQEQYRAIYGNDAPDRIEFASWGRRVLGYLVDTFLHAVVSIPLFLGYWALVDELEYETDSLGNQTISDTTDVSDTTVAILVIGGLISLAFFIYNQFIRQGRTGYTPRQDGRRHPAGQGLDGASRWVPGCASCASSRTTSTASSATSAGCGRCGTAGTRPSPTRS